MTDEEGDSINDEDVEVEEKEMFKRKRVVV